MRRSPEALERQLAQLDTLKAVAMQRLLDGASKESISTELGILPSVMIRYEIELEAKRQHKILTEAYLEGRKQLLPEVLHCGLNLIANAFRAVEASGEAITLRDAETVSKIIANVDHIARLDAGDPTQIVDLNRTVPATFKDIVAAFRKDPFIDTKLLLEELDYTVKQETEDNGDTNEAAIRED